MNSKYPEGRDYWETLARVSLRRLLRLRHSPRHGSDARQAAHKWVQLLREVSALILCAAVAIGACFTISAPARAGAFDDVARIDFPARNQSLFMAGCFSLYTQFSYAGMNCAGSSIQSPIPQPVAYAMHEALVSTVFDTDRVWLVDAPCILVDIVQYANYRALYLVCYDDVITANSFEQAP